MSIKEFNLGQKVDIQVQFFGEKRKNIISGNVIFKNDHFITVRTRNYNTSVNLIDFADCTAILLRG